MRCSLWKLSLATIVALGCTALLAQGPQPGGAAPAGAVRQPTPVAGRMPAVQRPLAAAQTPPLKAAAKPRRAKMHHRARPRLAVDLT